MDLSKPSCVICKKTDEEEPGLKKYTSRTSLLKAAERRRSLVSDKFSVATNAINAAEPSTDLFYHSKCHSQYCAVKRKATDDNTVYCYTICKQKHKATV
ncbi:hypothetical protein HOLleu_37050 [Holothuria leucospilota]|uniref:Uncharacterized protein n=1 Tax=Holothuria leucospilota TaxID=206669 RepID=A0A9Q1BH07_HOLLE|nr:hypothetical protein HOLleu_37050 [Holothuria leucospilota]